MQAKNSTYFSLPIAESGINSATGTSSGMAMTHRKHRQPMNPYEKHKELVKNYQMIQKTTTTTKSEAQILIENHKFLHEDTDQYDESMSWEQRLAKKYYEKLFKEYCLGDFSRYRTGQIGLRWRTKEECEVGRGQFTCANLKCTENKSLRSWEVNFAYAEHGERMNALVKIRCCRECSDKLNYRKLKDLRKAERATKKAESAGRFDDVLVLEDDQRESPRALESVTEKGHKISNKRKSLGEDSTEPSNKHPRDSIEIGKTHREELHDAGIPDNVWGAPAVAPEEEKTKEQLMDEYLEQFFQ